MHFLKNPFWQRALLTFIWCGFISLEYTVFGFYHPMIALGDRLHVLRISSILIPILVSFIMYGLWLWHGILSDRAYKIGTYLFLFAAALPFLPRWDNSYEHSYWLGEQRHSIPWEYDPYIGDEQPGGRRFLVRVRDLELTPYHAGEGDDFLIWKAVDFDHGNGGSGPENPCNIAENLIQCEWKEGDYVYSFSYMTNNASKDPYTILPAIVELMDSFETDDPLN